MPTQDRDVPTVNSDTTKTTNMFSLLKWVAIVAVVLGVAYLAYKYRSEKSKLQDEITVISAKLTQSEVSERTTSEKLYRVQLQCEEQKKKFEELEKKLNTLTAETDAKILKYKKKTKEYKEAYKYGSQQQSQCDSGVCTIPKSVKRNVMTTDE
jgi:uncharacterized protein HemX